jgi:hypothetical protein
MRKRWNHGDRVRVAIPRPNEYARGAAEALDGKMGTIDEVRGDGARYLVAFDEPAVPWHANALPIRAFWFEGDELAEVTP